MGIEALKDKSVIIYLYYLMTITFFLSCNQTPNLPNRDKLYPSPSINNKLTIFGTSYEVYGILERYPNYGAIYKDDEYTAQTKSVFVINYDTLKFFLKDHDSLYSLNRIFKLCNRGKFMDTLLYLHKSRKILSILRNNKDYIKEIDNSVDIAKINAFLIKHKVDSFSYRKNKKLFDVALTKALLPNSMIVNINLQEYLKIRKQIYGGRSFSIHDTIAQMTLQESEFCFNLASKYKTDLFISDYQYHPFNTNYFILRAYFNLHGILQFKKIPLSTFSPNNYYKAIYYFCRIRWCEGQGNYPKTKLNDLELR